MELTDTHCHVHEVVKRLTPVHDKWINGGVTDADVVLAEAKEQDVTRAICVGTSVEDSELAVDFVQNRQNVWASIGIHPHEAERYVDNTAILDAFLALATKSKVVAVGECGLDFFYNHSPKEDQIKILRFQIELALKHDLPMIFHVREAFSDFWPIFDEYTGIRGVIHSFSATRTELEQILARGLYIGLNGIMTFTKQSEQLEAAKAVPLDKLLLETDAPFLTPAPYRGTICQLKHVRVTAGFLANLRGESLEALAQATTANAQQLFKI
jgi:TatD DNase family protein